MPTRARRRAVLVKTFLEEIRAQGYIRGRSRTEFALVLVLINYILRYENFPIHYDLWLEESEREFTKRIVDAIETFAEDPEEASAIAAKLIQSIDRSILERYNLL